MTLIQYQKIKELVDLTIKEAKEQALKEGVDITSVDFEQAISILIKNIVSAKGFSLVEFNNAAQEVKNKKKKSFELIRKDQLEEEIAKIINPIIESFKNEQTAIFQKIEKVDKKQISFKQLLDKPEIVNKRDIEEQIGKIPKPKDYSPDIESTRIELISLLRDYFKKIPIQKDYSEDIDNLKWQFNEDIKKVKDQRTDEEKLREFEKHFIAYQTANPDSFRPKVIIRGGGGHSGEIPYYSKTQVGNVAENLSSQCDGVETAFTTSHIIQAIDYVYFNGGMLIEGKEVTKTGDKEITLDFAPPAGSDLRLKYIH